MYEYFKITLGLLEIDAKVNAHLVNILFKS